METFPLLHSRAAISDSSREVSGNSWMSMILKGSEKATFQLSQGLKAFNKYLLNECITKYISDINQLDRKANI